MPLRGVKGHTTTTTTTSKKTQHFAIAEIDLLILFNKIIAAYPENLTRLKYKMHNY
jgi:hypothetical protein